MRSGTPLYQKIAAEVRQLIESRILKAGDRLPSLREMSRVKGTSIPTIAEAYRHLEDLDLIRVRPQSGYYVTGPERRPGPSRPPLPAPVPAMDRQYALDRALDNGFGNLFDAAIPDDLFIPVRPLGRILAGLLRHDPGILGRSTSAWGDLDLRNQIARRLIDWNCHVDPEELVITNGGLEAIGLCLRVLTRPGDLVTVESPAYYGFLNLIDAFGLRVLEIPCDPAAGMDLDELRAALGKHPVKACLMSTSVSNPLGVTLSLARKRELLAILGQAGVPLIEDATFGDLHFGGPPPAARSLDPDDQVLLCASMTKTLAPGFRLGWVNPGRHARQLSAMKRVTSGDQSMLLQRALAVYLETGGYERHLRRARHELQARMRLAIDTIQATFPAGTRLAQPSGGFLLWIELPGPIDLEALQEAARDGGLRIAPGVVFSALGHFRRHFRLNVAQADPRRLAASLGQLGSLLGRPAS
jgi:DNA-binding transcriptional MocR family regulator